MIFTIEDCDDVIRRCLQDPKVMTDDYEIIPRHSNYIFKITPQKQKTLCLFAKPKSTVPAVDKIFYEEFKCLEEFDPKITPKFRCGKSDVNFFEDLTCQKFQNKLDKFDLRHLEKVLNVLAKVHAAGFAYERRTGKKLQEHFLKNANFDVDEFEDLIWRAADNKEKVIDIKEELKRRQQSNFPKTVCHGNLTKTNILYHYDNGVPDECKLVNFSDLYAPPVYDLLQVIFFNTDENFRKSHFQNLLCFYYKHLEENLKKYGLSIENFLSKEDYQKSVHELLPLIKLETVRVKKNEDGALRELEESLTFAKLTKEDCYSIVKNIIKSSDYNLLSFCLFNSQLTIKIRYMSIEKTINCFIKPVSKHKREIFIFDTFIVKLQEFGITTMNDCFPDCHFHDYNVLVFEDLSPKFQQPSDFQIVPSIVKKLAQFHASTLLFEEKMSKNLKMTYRLTDDFDNFETTDFDLIKDVVSSCPNLKFEDLKNRLQKLQNSLKDRFRCVLSLGILSKEKILTKIEGEDCRFVDCQNVKYYPPAYDILSVLQLIEDEEVRHENEEKVKMAYFEELGKIVAAYNCNVEKFLFYDEFIDSFDFCRPFVLLEKIIFKIDENQTEEIEGCVKELSDVYNMLPNV